MVWANFLHIYQPPTQKASILRRVVNESYRKVINGLLDHPNAKLTLNINGGLIEMLAEAGFSDVIDNLRKLISSGQVELTGSGKYHPLLPKLPKEEIVRQIKINEQTNRRFFGEKFKSVGFFPPEMGYSPEVGEVVKSLGYTWVILDEMAIPAPIEPNKLYQNSQGLYLFFRERGSSIKILSAQVGSVEIMLKEFGDRLKKNEYMLTAMDGETFGHHRPGLDQLLVEIYQDKRLSTVTISDLLKMYSQKVTVEPRASNWAMTESDLSQNMPFARWDDLLNPIHQKQWELARLVIRAVGKSEGKPRQLLDAALHSDQFWWASARPWWSLEMIEQGAHDLRQVVVESENTGVDVKEKAHRLYDDIVSLGFEWQRTGKVEEISRREDEEIKQRISRDKPFISSEEMDSLIKKLEEEMLMAAHAQEYVQAERIKARIKELKDERDGLAHQQELAVNQ